jgi:hypothetical protein
MLVVQLEGQIWPMQRPDYDSDAARSKFNHKPMPTYCILIYLDPDLYTYVVFLLSKDHTVINECNRKPGNFRIRRTRCGIPTLNERG